MSAHEIEQCKQDIQHLRQQIDELRGYVSFLVQTVRH